MITFKTFLENFMDNRHPEDKGDMARHHLKGKSISFDAISLKESSKSSIVLPPELKLYFF